LLRHGVKYRGPSARRAGDVEERVLSFEDGDGLMLEIVVTPLAEKRMGWDGAPGITGEAAVRGVYGVTLWEEDGAATRSLLVDLLGLERIDEDGTTQRFATGALGSRSIADVRSIGTFPRGNISVGTVHHVAWRVGDDRMQLDQRDRLIAAGLQPTPVIDRQYFHSVYFFEPGGILFELATEPPGFTIDEPRDQLGERLMLPPQYESSRAQIAAVLPEIQAPASAGAHYRDEE
jgi:glyoxalase family protein